MNLLRCLLLSLCALACSFASSPIRAETISLEPHLAKLRAVGPKGEGHRAASAAAKTLSQADIDQVPELLAGMDGAGELAVNWFRPVVETVVQRGQTAGKKLPQDKLEKFLADTSHHPRARRLAYELIARVDKTAQQRLIPPLLNDPSLELRRDAVALALAEADKLAENLQQAPAISAYRQALTAARDLDQINQAAEALRKLGEKVDLPSHFGFVMRWKLIGPFDNTGSKGFDVAYPPQEELDFAAVYRGKEGEVRWVNFTTDHEFGQVDLNKVLGKSMGAIGYAASEFVSEADRAVEIRLGTTNANKIWLNGELLTRNNVYHAGEFIDQYVAQGKLKKGNNTILVLIAQNEQTEAWAQDWRFQLRVCDQYGSAILSQDRPRDQTAQNSNLRSAISVAGLARVQPAPRSGQQSAISRQLAPD